MLSLDELEPYFDELDFDPEQEQVDELFEVFKSDFIDDSFELKGIPVKIKTALSTHKGLPNYFSDYYHIFVHCITYKSDITNRRQFEPERANRVHWIKPILVHHTDSRIKYYQFTENDGKVRDYYWYEEMAYVVIVEKITTDYWLVTGHCVDDVQKHRKRFQKFKFGK
jgi:hypothetical protein